MRGIKFRGQISKGIENAGQWIYWGLNGTDMLDVIDPDTVGQFTGLKDIDDEDIFEGDIVSLSYGLPPTSARLLVQWNDDMHLDSDQPSGMGWWFEGLNGALSAPMSKTYEGSLSVIGNIYENPELMEGA